MKQKDATGQGYTTHEARGMNGKRKLSSLACLGGVPAFDRELHVGCPNVGNRRRFYERLDDLLDRRWLTNGGCYVREFESRIAQLLGVRHCITVCNGTTGLQVALRALGLQGEVIVPSFTFVATVHALHWLGLKPVFCDVDAHTHNLDPRLVEQAITPRTSAILAVHLWGRPCDTVALHDIAARHGLKLLYDAAHAFGCSHRKHMIGAFGDVEVFSFHATKFINTFEGGAIVTNDDDLAAKLRQMSVFGLDDAGHNVSAGINAKMTEVAAAMGLTLLESMDELVGVNYANYKQYQAQLSAVPGLTLVTYDEDKAQNYQYVVVEVDETITGISRDHLLHVLRAENVLARRYFYPGCHRLEPYRTLFPRAGQRLPVTERLTDRIMSLPTGTAVTSEDISLICNILRTAVAGGPQIVSRLDEVAINEFAAVWQQTPLRTS